MNRLLKIFSYVGFVFCLSVNASANSIRMDFLSFDFQEVGGGATPAAQAAVTGTIYWEGKNDLMLFGEVDHFHGINLNIGGHAYSLSEIGTNVIQNGVNRDIYIGGLLNGADSISKGADDFWIKWTTNQMDEYVFNSFGFQYSINNKNHAWASSKNYYALYNLAYYPEPFAPLFEDAPEYKLAKSYVPEPSAFWLLLIGFAGLLVRFYKK